MKDFGYLKDKNIAILGFGREGKSTLEFLLDHNVHCKNITILDANQSIDSPDTVKSLTGDHHLQGLETYDIIFKSSGVPITPELLPYKDKITSQVQLFFDSYPGKVIAVTASKGKSTISSLAYDLLIKAGYRAKLIGNIGTPVLEAIAVCQSPVPGGHPAFCEVEEEDFVVVELSSYMLEDLQKHNYISILGTIFPEHLDWHGSFDKYVEAKLNILQGSDIAIVYGPTLQQYPQHLFSQVIPYGKGSSYIWDIEGYFTHNGQRLFPTQERNIPGDHNLENITAIIALADVLGIPQNIVHKTIKEYKGLPHRLEELGTYGGIRRIDDAISTTPESTIEAIRTFGEEIDTILLGGTDRGYDFSGLAAFLAQYPIRNIVLFSPSGGAIDTALQKYAEQSNKKDWYSKLNILATDDMQEAVQFASKYTAQGKICLLSTASPSYSLWKNFEEKGALFKKYIVDSL